MTRLGMLVDLRRCAGCYACVVACQMWNNEKPGVAWNHVELREWDDGETAHRSYLPHACMHCVDAPCVAACSTGASYAREDGIVVVDYDTCTGCGMCLEACPYGARTINTNDAWFFDAESPAPYEAEGIQRINVAEKCIFCYPRVDQGLEPACVHTCPGRARTFGDLDDPESEVSQAIAAGGESVHSIPNTSFAYIPFETMPESMLPTPVLASNSKRDKSEPAKEAGGIDPVVVAGGAAVVAAVGVGIGVAVNNSKKKKTAQGNVENDGTSPDGKEGE